MIAVEDLPALVNDPSKLSEPHDIFMGSDFDIDTNLHKIYVVHALPNSYITRTDGAPYERSGYYANPSSYQSHFHTKVNHLLLRLVFSA